MHNTHQNQLQSLLDQNALFQQLVHKKLSNVLIDTKKSTISSLSSLKATADYIRSQLSLNSAQHDELISMFIEMQATFQYQDIIQQTIERLQEAMQSRDELLMSLSYSISNPEEIQLLTSKMKKIVSKYEKMENQHISSVHEKDLEKLNNIGTHIELF